MFLRSCILGYLLLMASATQAQKVKVVSSSSTGWSGGIAGRYGVNYNFTVEFSGFKKQEPTPDTFWIGNKPFPVQLKEDVVHRPFNTIKTVTDKKRITYVFIGGTNQDDSPMYKVNATDDKKADLVKPTPPIPYKGVALVSYNYNGIRKYFVIDKVMTQGRPVNYP